MDVHEAIAARRAYRSLLPVPITRELIEDLARNAQLSPSCFNNQPWRFVFVYGKENLEHFHPVLESPGNDWARAASLIVAVCSRKEDDCVIPPREYHLFGDGMAVAFLMLRATELGLVAHPISGYNPEKAREVLGIPEAYTVITLINIGKHADTISPVLSPSQAAKETVRPPRKPLRDFAFDNRFGRAFPEENPS